MAAVEIFADQPSTIVSSGGTTNSDTSFTVATPGAFPQASNSATPPTQFHIVDTNPAKQSEIMAVTNVSGSTWTVTRGAEGTTGIAHNAGWTAVQVVTSGYLSTVNGQYFGYPWQFYPENFGAVGDGKIIADAVLTSNTTLTSATAGFTSADTGKHIMINGGAGTTSPPLVTTITFSNSTTVTLGSAASVSGSAFVAVYGTDDTTAIGNAVTAAGNYATAHQYFAEVVFAAKYYVLSSGPTQSGNGTSTPTFNAQIPLPYPAANGATQKMVIALTGAGDAGFYEYWESLTPAAAGTVLVSMLKNAPSTPDATFGNQSVIGGPAGSAGFTGGFANVKVVIKGIQVISPAYTNQYAFDLGYVSAMRITSSSAHIFAPTGVNGGNSPLLKDLPAQGGFQATIGAGLRSPVVGNNADIYADDFTVEGYARGLYVFDHFAAPKISAIYNDVALKVDLTQGLSGVSHGVWIGLFGCEVYNGGISVSGGGGSYVPLYITMDAECTGVTYDISDSGGVAHGVVHWTDPADTRAPVITTGGNPLLLKVVNDKLGPGQWTGGMTPAVPSVPLTTVAQVNTAYRDATVYLTSGGAAVTVIAVDSTTTGLTLGTTGTVAVRVPSGHSITLTYASTAPTWVWVLD